MPPKFTLQPVLDYRETRVEILEIELGRLLQAQKRCLTFLEALNSSRDRILSELGKKQTGEIDLYMIARLHANLELVNERIQEQQTRLNEINRQIYEKQQEIIHAKQDAEALVKLKEHEIERFKKEEAKKENRLQDDIYIARAYHHSNGVA